MLYFCETLYNTSILIIYNHTSNTTTNNSNSNNTVHNDSNHTNNDIHNIWFAPTPAWSPLFYYSLFIISLLFIINYFFIIHH